MTENICRAAPRQACTTEYEQECSTEYEQQCANVPQETCTTVYETVCETAGKTDNIVDKVGFKRLCLDCFSPDHEAAQPRDRRCHCCCLRFPWCHRPIRLNHNLLWIWIHLHVLRIRLNIHLLWSSSGNCVQLIRLWFHLSKWCSGCCCW